MCLTHTKNARIHHVKADRPATQLGTAAYDPKESSPTYLPIAYSISHWLSLKPALGSNTLTVRTIPVIPASLPVPPVMNPVLVETAFFEPSGFMVFCATFAARTKNLSTVSMIKTW